MKILVLVMIVLCAGSFQARACMRETVDEKAVQWSSLICEATLTDISERIQLKVVTQKQPTGEINAAYWYRVYSFEVDKIIDQNGKDTVKPKHRVEIVRFFTKVEAPMTQCANHLTKDAIGKPFVLFLRPEKDIKFEKPPIWTDPKNTDPRDGEVHLHNAYGVIHLQPKSSLTEDQLSAFKRTIAQTRQAEKRIGDPDIKKHIDALIKSPEDAAAAEALNKIGWKAVGAVKAARDKKETPAAAKARLAALAIELSPTPFKVSAE